MNRNSATVVAYSKCHTAVISMPFRFDRLKTARQRAHYTQQEVADILGVTGQTISEFERGKREPNNERLAQLCRIYGVSADYLLDLVEQPDQHVNIDGLRIDQQILLQWYEEGKLPRYIHKMIVASSGPDFIDGKHDAARIESGSEVGTSSKQKAS